MNYKPVQLWSDEPTSVDLLAFGAVAETAVEAVLDDALDPIALGISGPWGSGKSTVLKLIKAELASRDAVSEDEATSSDTQPYFSSSAVRALRTSSISVAFAPTSGSYLQGSVSTTRICLSAPSRRATPSLTSGCWYWSMTSTDACRTRSSTLSKR